MNQTTKFEDRLLDDLKSVVASREAERRETKRRFGWKPRLALAGALAAAIAVGVPVVQGQDAQPAWSVEPRGDGWVTVKVRSPEDPQGLEDELEKYVPNASVNLPPPGKMCKPGWYDESTRGFGVMGSYYRRGDDGRLRPIDHGFRADELTSDTTLIVDFQLLQEEVGRAGPTKGLDIAKGRVGHCPVVPDNQ